MGTSEPVLIVLFPLFHIRQLSNLYSVRSEILIPFAFLIDFTTPRRATEMCSYPSWFNNKEWSDLKGEHIYRYDSVTNELVVDKQPVGSSKLQETVQRFTCEKKTSNDRYRFVTKVTNEW